MRKSTALEKLRETVITDNNISARKIHLMVPDVDWKQAFSVQTEIWHLDPNSKLGIVAICHLLTSARM